MPSKVQILHPPPVLKFSKIEEYSVPDLMVILTALLIGGTAGIASGLFGIGGGIIIVPMLIFFLKFSSSKAIGTSLTSMLLPVGILAVMKYYKAGDVDLKVGLAIAAGIFVTAFFGAKLGLSLGNVWVTRGFGILLLLVSLKLIFS